MKPRKLLALALTFALTATIAVPALAEDILSGSSAAPKFNDTQGHWAEEIIDRWGGYGVVQGDQNGNFNPDQPIHPRLHGHRHGEPAGPVREAR